MPLTPPACLNILHFEDNALDAQIVKSAILEIETRCEIVRVDRHQSYISTLEQNAFDLILCDYEVGDPLGAAAIDAALQKQPAVPVIVVSQLPDETEAAQWLRKGAIDFLAKSQVERLVPVIKRALRQAELAREQLHVVKALKDAAQQMKELNEHLREQASFLDKTRDAIFVMDLDHRITYWNKGAERMYGWTAGEAVGELADALLRTPTQDVQEAYETVVAHDEWTGEMQRFTKHGRQLTIEAHWTIVRGPDGRPKNVLARNTDLTERRQLERRCCQAQKMQSIGQLAGGIAHDFNNVMTVINGLADLVLENPALPEALHQDLRDIRAAGDRATSLTRQLLAFSRKQILKPGVISLNTIIRDMERMLGRLIGEDISLVVQLDEHLESVYIDAGQFEQVIANIAINARDAMPSGGKLTIMTSTLELNGIGEMLGGLFVPSGRYAALLISDTGCGMDENTRAHLFEPFFTTKGSAGTGLGLATVYGIVKQSNGFVWVDSELGRGTTFTIMFPVAVNGHAAVLTQTEQVRSGIGTESVLVVEDVTGIRDLTRRSLESAGYHVLTAADGEEAAAMLEHGPELIDLIISDASCQRWADAVSPNGASGDAPARRSCSCPDTPTM
jgi:two-component system cell cycle sensor histidine kinase/response regulator CckA